MTAAELRAAERRERARRHVGETLAALAERNADQAENAAEDVGPSAVAEHLRAHARRRRADARRLRGQA